MEVSLNKLYYDPEQRPAFAGAHYLVQKTKNNFGKDTKQK